MDDNRSVQVFLKVFCNLFDVFHVGLDDVYCSDPMELLSGLFDIEVQRDIVFPEIFESEQGGDDIMVGLVKYDDFPGVVGFGEYFGKQILLFMNKVDFRVEEGNH